MSPLIDRVHALEDKHGSLANIADDDPELIELNKFANNNNEVTVHHMELDDRKEEFFTAYNNGHLDPQLAREFDTSVSSIYRYRKKYGLKSNRLFYRVIGHGESHDFKNLSEAGKFFNMDYTSSFIDVERHANKKGYTIMRTSGRFER